VRGSWRRWIAGTQRLAVGSLGKGRVCGGRAGRRWGAVEKGEAAKVAMREALVRQLGKHVTKGAPMSGEAPLRRT
jgi:hypothetical protein